MADELILTSTTDSVAQVREALGLKPETTEAPKAEETPTTTEPAAEETQEATAPPEPTPLESQAGKVLQQKKQKTQARIDRLSAEAKQAKEDRDAERRARARVEGELLALRAAQQAAFAAPPASATPDAPALKPEPKESDFDTFAEFSRAQAEWAAEKQTSVLRTQLEQMRRERDEALTRQRQAFDEAQAQLRQKAFAERLQMTKERHKDAEEVFQKNKDLDLGPVLHHAVVTSELGAELLYYLATHPDEVSGVRGKTPPEIERFVGRLEARAEDGRLFSEATDDTPPAKPAETAPAPVATTRPAVSRMPAPLNRLGGGGATQVVKDPSAMTMAEYNAWRNATGRRRK